MKRDLEDRRRDATVRQIDGTLLLAFEILMQERHVTRAAARLGVTQSAMSGIVSRLRRLLRDQLFIRTPTGVQPTSVATELLGRVHAALDILRAIAIDPAGFSPEAGYSFVVGMSDYSGCVLLPPLLRRMRREFSNITVHAQTVSAQAAPALLDEGKIDLMIGPLVRDAGRFKHSHLLFDSFVALMPRSHPEATKAFDMGLFTSLPHVIVAPDGLTNGWTGLLDDRLAQEGARRDVRLTLNQFMLGFLVLPQTDMVFSVPSRLASVASSHFDVETKQLPFAPPRFAVSQIWHVRNDALPSNVWLRAQIRAIVDDLGARKEEVSAGG